MSAILNMDEAITKDEMNSFAALGLQVGDHLSMQTVSPPKKFMVTLLGFTEDKSIMVSPPTLRGQEVKLLKDAVVTIRFLVGKKVCAFSSKVLYRSVQPYTYYHLHYPSQDDLVSLQVRNSERVDLNLPCDVENEFNVFEDWPQEAHILNLSKTGARLSSPHLLGQEEHDLNLTFTIMVSGIEKETTLHAIIRNVELEEDDTYSYGLQFIQVSAENTIALTSYILEMGR